MYDPAVSEREGAFALEKIFGPRHRFRFHGRLPDIDELKKAFRRQSLRLHPDRARLLGRTEDVLTREFQSVCEAYRLLLSVVAGRRRSAAAEHTSASPSAAMTSDFYWTLKHVPPITLRFAQFLYYKGIISFKTLIRAVVWQAERRPRTGELAVRSGELTSEQVHAVLDKKRIREPFLTAAVRLGYMSAPARRRVLSAQKAYNLPIGRYFLETGILTEARLTALLAECKEHNRSITVTA